MRGFLNAIIKRAAVRPSALVLPGLAAAFAPAMLNANAALRSSEQQGPNAQCFAE